MQTLALGSGVGGFLPGVFSDLQPHQSEPSFAPATDGDILSGPLPEVSAVGGLCGPPYLPFLLSLGLFRGAGWSGAANRQPGGRVPVRGAQPAPSLAPLSLPYLAPCIRGGLGEEGSGK